ncbi:aminotransferase class III-fold pyridoxal phosphate-dependent enzyme [Paenibacillus sp. LMG 31458]|uniref:Aminotransferase class III-fold pyridoxal phosphate-dependent enzyme n=1 Tax=Paenibacillus phytorum TaxID=2654977 RepID=A0ABX1XUR3_9BACL|nr:aspartate aminotransferase family protein [Paenibacillus phytorum]NOU71600.1 aminotransferase class III-fold pyridoxal phosphate-dependent enzyme [Paenibacillus phytorum]
MISISESKVKMEEAKKYIPGGVASSLRSSMKPVPLYVQDASGARVVDVNNNVYIDYLLAYGPLILGHAHPDLTRNIHEALLRGSTYGLQHDGEIRLAKRLTEILPCADQVAFSGSGTEAVMLALRLARAYTGKTKIVRFYGHYHGWSDSIFTSFPSPDFGSVQKDSLLSAAAPGTGGQSNGSLQELILLPWNDPDALEKALNEHSHDIAAVITEPVMCNSGCIAPKPGYMAFMREITSRMGIVLIWDEVITGFRFGLGGAHERFGIQPDLVTIGKAMAGGIPLSAVAGKKEILQLIEEGKVLHLGTLNGNSLSTAAGLTVIDTLSKDGSFAFSKLEAMAVMLAEGIRTLLKNKRISGVVNQLGPVFHVMFIDREEVSDFDTFNLRDTQAYTFFTEKLLEEGVLIRQTGLWYVSTAHGEAEVKETLQAIDRVLDKMKLSTSRA